ncbi:DNA polymerase III subunit gamma/tau [Anaerovibrio lipolyticus]|uniref:DNA polymerase III subunit gamma/tau n=1 Tax=Anaerovibrio lipolyticus TaxID=82374 RepID=UPI0026EAF0D4|nr:DNA polymerase III subunit gamma/tau [Anaerovibrio lipolyticus]MBE6106896.1 DNA polymerase III subunit gamma/tau [Anaerovibrio lipolyticus]
MAYMALYRKWRPDNFANLVGQDHVSRTLANAIKSGRIGHAYLFTGPRGTGKTSTAKILAKALNCEQGPTVEPCNQCEACQRINSGNSMDVFEIDAASNRGIEAIRDLRENVKFAPVNGRYKVYIIDEVHMLTSEAFNALLKTLEEPPAHVVFIMATTEVYKVPATIQSRCQRYDFKRITVDDIFNRLKTVVEDMDIKADDDALRMIAVKADGGMRDALSILDQCIALSEQSLTIDRVQQLLGLVGKEWLDKLVGALQSKDAAAVLTMVDEIIRAGKDLQQVLGELGIHFRGLMIFKAAGLVDGVDYYSQTDESIKKQAAGFTQEQIVWIIRRVHEAANEVKWSPQPRIAVEAALLEICQRDNLMNTASTTDKVSSVQSVDDGRIAQLEAKLARMMGMLKSGGAVGNGVSGKDSVATIPSAAKVTTAVAKPIQVAANITEDGVELWQRTLDNLRSTGKEQVMACLQNCTFMGLNDVQFVLGTPKGVIKGLLERIYRKNIEEAFNGVSGLSLSMVCQEVETVPEPTPRKGDIQEDVPPPTDDDFGISELQDDERERLDKAVDVFGDGFVHPEDLQ